MGRPTRWTLNALTALSLLLCVAVVVLWVRSRQHYDLVQVRQFGAPRPGEGRAWYFAASSSSETLRFVLARQSFGPVYLRRLSPDEMTSFRAWYPPGFHFWAAGRAERLFL